MTEAKVRDAAEKHAAAVVAGDVESLLADLDPSLHDQVAGMSALMPEGLSAAELLSVSADAAGTTTETKYVGRDASLTVRATWEQRGDRYIVIAAQPVQEGE